MPQSLKGAFAQFYVFIFCWLQLNCLRETSEREQENCSNVIILNLSIIPKPLLMQSEGNSLLMGRCIKGNSDNKDTGVVNMMT